MSELLRLVSNLPARPVAVISLSYFPARLIDLALRVCLEQDITARRELQILICLAACLALYVLVVCVLWQRVVGPSASSTITDAAPITPPSARKRRVGKAHRSHPG